MRTIILSLGVAGATYTLFVEPFLLNVNYYTIESEKIPPEFDGYKIAIISDVHYTSYLTEYFLKRIINKTNSLDVDLIVGLGDYVKGHKNVKELIVAWRHMQNLKAKDGVLMINGNHDHWADHESSLKLLKESGLSVRHQHRVITHNKQSIVVAGAGDFYEDSPGIDKALRGTPENLFRIVLAHNPDTIDLPRVNHVDLFLCGHTHGGQVAIPFFNYAPILPLNNKSYDRGFRKSAQGEDIFIGRGIGTSILPVRFNSPPEIPVIILKRIPTETR
ncbi:MAG: metallophosphoesterase [Leptospirales bacterium]